MKKLIFIFALILATATSVAAHPGETDSAGGHTDHSTGEYHYHHGYSAHSHYDMDGDGDVDCPYDFHDKTGINSGGSSASNSYSTNRYTEKDDDNVIVKTKTVTKKVPYIPSWVYWVIGILSVTCLIMFLNIRWKNEEIQWKDKEIKDWESRYKSATAEHEKHIDEIKKTCSAKIEHNKTFYENKIRILSDKFGETSK